MILSNTLSRCPAWPARLALSLVVVLAGCHAVGPDFSAPQTSAPDTWNDWRSADAALSSDLLYGNGEPEAESWRRFNDPVLDTLQQRARAASPDVRTAALRFAQSRVQRTTVAAQRGPRLDASGAATRQRQSEYSAGTRLVDAVAPNNRDDLVSVLSDPFALYQAGFDASWEVDLWGRVRRSVEAADANVQEAGAGYDQMLLSVQSEIARQYFDLRSAQQLLALTQADIDASRTQLDLAQARADGGLVTGLDPATQRTQLADLQSRLPTLQASIGQRLNQIGLLTGDRPGDLNTLLAAPAGPVDPHALPATLPDLSLGLPGEVVRRRPDIRAAEARLHAATANIGVATADLYPRITLGANFGLESTKGGKFGEWGTRTWQIGPSLSLPIFDQGRRRSVITLRQLQQQESAVAFQQTVLKAWQEIDDALTHYAAERRKNAALRATLDAAEDAWTLARAQYAGGLITFLPQLDAERNVLQIRRALTDSNHQLFVAWVSVNKAVGGAGVASDAVSDS